MSDDNQKQDPTESEFIQKLAENPKLTEAFENFRANGNTVSNPMSSIQAQVEEMKVRGQQQQEAAVKAQQQRDTTQTEILDELRAIRTLLERLVAKND